MTHTQELQQRIDFWQSKLAGAEAATGRATALVTDTDDPDAVLALLQHAATDTMAAKHALAALEAKRPEAQALDLEAEAVALVTHAAKLEAQAAPITAEADKLIAAALALGVRLDRRGAPQADHDLLEAARACRGDANQLRTRARLLANGRAL